MNSDLCRYWHVLYIPQLFIWVWWVKEYYIVFMTVCFAYTCVHMYICHYLNGLVYLLCLLWTQNMYLGTYGSKATFQLLFVFFFTTSWNLQELAILTFSARFKLAYEIRSFWRINKKMVWITFVYLGNWDHWHPLCIALSTQELLYWPLVQEIIILVNITTIC